jgi:hypothetical protein
MSESQNTITELWNEIKAVVAAAEVDVAKNAGGNSAAGVRVRKALRVLKGKSADLVKLTISEEKSRKA